MVFLHAGGEEGGGGLQEGVQLSRKLQRTKLAQTFWSFPTHLQEQLPPLGQLTENSQGEGLFHTS